MLKKGDKEENGPNGGEGKPAFNWKKPWAEPMRGEARRRAWPLTKSYWSCWTNQDQQTDSEDHLSQQSSDDISALQNPVVPSPTEQELFISLIWCLPGSSRADEDNVTAPNTEHQYSGGQPPPQIPSKFIHLCFPKWAHPHISDHKKALQSEDSFAPFFARSDAFMRGTVVYRMTSRQCDVADSSDVEDRVRSGARGSEIVAAFFSYLFHLFGTENCRTQKSGVLWDCFSRASKDFCHCWQAVAVVIQLQSVSVLSSSCRWDPGESVDSLSSKPGLLLHGETVKVENREQHCPLLLVQPPADV